MDTASTLVRIYLFICQRYRGRRAAVAQRQSNNSDPEFTDEEMLSLRTEDGIHIQVAADHQETFYKLVYEIFGSPDREQVLDALRLNRTILHEPQPDAEVDEPAVRRTIDRLLDQRADLS